jgi:hypothetical protein
MATENQTLTKKAEQLYEHYGKPLEPEHAGKYVAISHEGKTIIGTTVLDVAQRAKAAFGPGSFVFKIGERAVWKFR